MTCLLLAGLTAGCRIVRSTAELPGKAVSTVTPGKKEKHVVDPVDLQQQLMRFADEFSYDMVSGIDRLRRGTNALDGVESHRLKLTYLGDTMAIATGPNAVANLLDMVVLVSVSRQVIQDVWIPRLYGESARPLLETCQRMESNIWHIASSVLKPPQREELRHAIAEWRRANPDASAGVYNRALGLASQVGQSSAGASQSGSVFSLLMIDPLSGLDPATREIAQARLMAERALFLGQRMPLVLRWQTELFSLNTAQMPEVQQVLTNVPPLSASIERFSRVAQQLPDRVSIERKEILAAFDAQGTKLSGLAVEVRQALTEGEKMAASLTTTLTTFDAVMKRFGVGEGERPAAPDTNSPPFNILHYAQTARELATAAKELDAVVKDFDAAIGSPAWSKRMEDFQGLSRQAQSDAKAILNHAFLLGAGLIMLAFVCAAVYGRFFRKTVSSQGIQRPEK